jgi:hypothetical protein
MRTRTRTLDPSATPEYRAFMAATVLACGLAVVGSVIPAVEHAVNLGLLGLGALAALVTVVRLLVRFVRERIEDAADARTAAEWRAAHQHIAQSQRMPVGVL